MSVIAIINKRLLLNKFCQHVFSNENGLTNNSIYITQEWLLNVECLVIDK